MPVLLTEAVQEPVPVNVEVCVTVLEGVVEGVPVSVFD